MAQTAAARTTQASVATAPPAQVLGAGILALAHAVNDSYAYILPALLPLLLTQAGLTLGTGAALVSLQQLASSFVQPLIGHWADRTGGGRWMSWSGLLLSGAGAAALGFAPGFGWLAVAMLINGLGASLFHPVSAALVARAAPPAQRGFWMSAYISAGNLGLGLGPLLVGLVLVQTGLAGTWLLALPALVAAVLLWRLAPARPGRAAAESSPLLSVLRRHWRVLAALVAVVAVRSWASTTFTTFLPVLASGRGASPADAAQVLTVFLVAGALGGFVGGAISDRLGRDQVVIGSLVLSVPCGVSVALMGDFGLAFWVAAAASGFFVNGSWIPLTVRGQESVPSSVAMMSGLMLGLSIGLGGVAVAPLGRLAESVGLPGVVAAVACLPLLGAVIMRFVPAPGAADAE